MATATNGHITRYTRGLTCPVCGGSQNDKRGQGQRCHGFIGSDGEYAHCSREDYASGAELPFYPDTSTWAHRLGGSCLCGTEHAPPRPGSDRSGGKFDIEATYDYLDADKHLLYQTVRLRPKDFRQRRRDPAAKGGWAWNLKGVTPVLYRLPELLAADPSATVIFVEGEKDADRLAKLGQVATCNPMGAGKWRDHYAESLRGRRVVVIADNDDVGRRHADDVARGAHGIAAEVKVVGLPEVPKHGDVSDYLNHGHSLSDLLRLADETAPWQPSAESAREDGAGHGTNGQANGQAAAPVLRLATRSVRDIDITPVEFLCEPHVPKGMIVNLAGNGGEGKSLLALAIAADLSAGRPPLGMAEVPGGPVDILVIAAEDGAGDTIKPRLLAAGADMDRIEVVDGVENAKGEIIPFDITYLPLVRRHIEEGRAKGKDYRLIAIDPITTYVGRAKVDDHRDAQLKPALEGLSRIAQDLGVTFLCLIHLNKGGNGKSAIYRVMGGSSYVTSSRLTYLYGGDPDDESRRILAPLKCNLPEWPPSLAVRVEPIAQEEALEMLRDHVAKLSDAQVAKLAGQLRRLAYEGESEVTADQIVAGATQTGRQADASGFLREILGSGVPVASDSVFQQGREHTPKISRDALFEAKKRLGIKARKIGSTWHWVMEGIPPDTDGGPVDVEY